MSSLPVQLGGSHCCACSRACHHIGPVRLCDDHRGTRSPVAPSPSSTELDALRSQERKGLETAINNALTLIVRVRKLHYANDDGRCAEDGYPMPCRTIQVLDGNEGQ